ncbi:eukaryotic initiation factor 4A-6-like [Primulina tabacum]|uniref:eukaryotic initiation factor 4A-6-like n=1 Tax=Primulina tabacum TaxID=48773 RepID=UPI003F5AD46F
MEELRLKKFLITTDALASELVDEEVSLVINYDLPVHARQYLHHTGWHGRFSSYVTVINFVGEEDWKLVQLIEKIYKIKIDQMTPNVYETMMLL